MPCHNYAWPSDTVQFGERIFEFSAKEGGLWVSELVSTGMRGKVIELNTEIPVEGGWSGVCAFGGEILVIGGGEGWDGDPDGQGSTPRGPGYSALSAAIGEGLLTSSSVHATRLAVSSERPWPGGSRLCRVSETRALLSFPYQSDLWYCGIEDGHLEIRKAARNSGACPRYPPVRLPDGKLLAVDRRASDIVRMTCEEKPRCEVIGHAPEGVEVNHSLALLADRFLVGIDRDGAPPWSLTCRPAESL